MTQLGKVKLGILPPLLPSGIDWRVQAICLYIHRDQERKIVPTICKQEPVNLEIAASLTILFGFLRVESQIGKRFPFLLAVSYLRDQGNRIVPIL